MTDPAPASPRPFEFWKAAYLVEVTPYRAGRLGQLLTGVTLAADPSIFFHLHHHFFREPRRLPEYPNDFADWAHAGLGDAVVAERLANLNLFRSANLAAVRREISVILAEHLRERGDERQAAAGQEFVFCQPRLVVFATGRLARAPAELLEGLREVDSDVIGYHLFAPKLAPDRVSNDFARWFRRLGHEALAAQLDAFDPYLNSLEDNRAYLLEMLEAGLGDAATGGRP